ncbi:hypothetical protein ABT160_23090 [Streptomyces sp. NPDC001941]|uniref:hypothetical protein n=1 Tax=Streptomyces sp. NPDC001941 TaxID=3154659 RepID=UPI00332BE092
MYEPQDADHGARPGPLEPEQVIAWLRDRDAVGQTLQNAVDHLPSQRDVTLATMADVLQATAQGLELPAAAVWAGVSESVLRGWIDGDPAFASALYACAALAAAHGLRPGHDSTTPAMLRLLLSALSGGATKNDAARLVGVPERRLRRLTREFPALAGLLDAARSVRPRPRRSRPAYVPSTYRPRRPGQRTPAHGAFRLVQREDREGTA